MRSNYLFIVSFLCFLSLGCGSPTNVSRPAFDELFTIDYCDGQVGRKKDVAGDIVYIATTRNCGSRFRTKKAYVHGVFGLKMKLPYRTTNGIASTFYLSTLSSQLRRELDEVDVEFIQTGSKIRLQTNWWSRGRGDHEIAHELWFDPTAAYHDYKIMWTARRLVWLIDDHVIRSVVRNNTDVLDPFPDKPMYLYASMWEAEAWLGPVNWRQTRTYTTWYRDWTVWGIKEVEPDNSTLVA